MNEISGTALAVDLGEADAVQKITDRVESLWGGLDILINNAGVTRDRTLTKMAPEEWQLVLRINLDVPRRLTEALTTARGQKKSALMARDGRVLFLSSVVGFAGNFGQTNYSAAKAGLLGLMRSEAKRLSPRGITVNALAPGFIETAMTGHIPLVPRTFGRRLCSLKQGGLPEDVAQAATFLASPGAYAITGNSLRVCGQSLIG